MRFTVTGLTGGDGLVLVGVTVGTSQSAVFERTGRQFLCCFLVTGATVGILDLLILVGHGRRFMGLMTFFTITGHHLGGMGFVTLGAQGDLAVRIVTGAAVELGVFARGFLELFDLLFVAGQAGGGHCLAKSYDLGSVRIVVTLFTVWQLEMGGAGVTLTADGDVFTHRWRVAVVTVLTADCRLVGQALSLNVGRGLAVTLDAVAVVKFGGSRGRCCHRGCREEQQSGQKE